MSLEKTCEFNKIIGDIIDQEQFSELKDELHHGISRYNHCLRVAKGTYIVTKKFNLDYEKATRAALLHDFFTDEQTREYSAKKTFKVHPQIALDNAKKYFELDKKQENIISSHMFPVCNEIPHCKEAWITTIVDKTVAIYEMYRFKASLVMGIYLLFILNMITLIKNNLIL